ncbi:MAG: hypothetical protein NUV81_04195 [bacterium]|nr:hypothetical protein [bacterium]
MAKTSTKTKVSTRTKVLVGFAAGSLAVAAGLGYWNSRRPNNFTRPSSQLPQVNQQPTTPPGGSGSPFGKPLDNTNDQPTSAEKEADNGTVNIPPKEVIKEDGRGTGIDETPTTATIDNGSTTGTPLDNSGAPIPGNTTDTTQDPSSAGSGSGN